MLCTTSARTYARCTVYKNTLKYMLGGKGNTQSLILNLDLAQNKFSRHIYTNLHLSHPQTQRFSISSSDQMLKHVVCKHSVAIHMFTVRNFNVQRLAFKFYSCQHGNACETGFGPHNVTMLCWNLMDMFKFTSVNLQKCHM